MPTGQTLIDYLYIRHCSYSSLDREQNLMVASLSFWNTFFSCVLILCWVFLVSDNIWITCTATISCLAQTNENLGLLCLLSVITVSFKMLCGSVFLQVLYYHRRHYYFYSPKEPFLHFSLVTPSQWNFSTTDICCLCISSCVWPLGMPWTVVISDICSPWEPFFSSSLGHYLCWWETGVLKAFLFSWTTPRTSQLTW